MRTFPDPGVCHGYRRVRTLPAFTVLRVKLSGQSSHERVAEATVTLCSFNSWATRSSTLMLGFPSACHTRKASRGAGLPQPGRRSSRAGAGGLRLFPDQFEREAFAHAKVADRPAGMTGLRKGRRPHVQIKRVALGRTYLLGQKGVTV